MNKETLTIFSETHLLTFGDVLKMHYIIDKPCNFFFFFTGVQQILLVSLQDQFSLPRHSAKQYLLISLSFKYGFFPSSYPENVNHCDVCHFPPNIFGKYICYAMIFTLSLWPDGGEALVEAELKMKLPDSWVFEWRRAAHKPEQLPECMYVRGALPLCSSP